MKTAVAAIEPEIIEPNHDLATQNSGGIVRTIARQIEAVRAAELRSTYEKLRLGAMVKQAVTLLGLEGRGNGHAGGGVKGWWDANFKGPEGEPIIAYKTLMMWIAAAEKLPALLTAERGGGVVAQDKMLALLAKDPEAVIAKSERKVLESAEKVANGMTLRQMLLWGDDAEPRRPGRPAGSVAGEYRKRTAEEAAVEAVWPTVSHLLNHRGEMFTAYKLLPNDKLAEFRDTLVEHVKAITAVLDQRK